MAFLASWLKRFKPRAGAKKRRLYLDLPGRNLNCPGDSGSWVRAEDGIITVSIAPCGQLSHDYAWALKRLCDAHDARMPHPGETSTFAEKEAYTKPFPRLRLREFKTEKEAVAYMIAAAFDMPMDGFLEGRDFQIVEDPR